MRNNCISEITCSTYSSISSCQLCYTKGQKMMSMKRWSVEWTRWLCSYLLCAVCRVTIWLKNKTKLLWKHIRFLHLLNKPVLFPWQQYQWQFGSCLPCTHQMANSNVDFITLALKLLCYFGVFCSALNAKQSLSVKTLASSTSLACFP